jgi:hypothetical protein
MKNLVAFIFCLVTFSFLAQTNSKDSIYVIKKANGVELIGKLVSDDGREVLLMTEKMGKVYISKSDIISMKLIEEGDVVNGEYIEEGPFTTRYSFTTNAFPVKQGENYAMINLYGPEIHFAVTDRLNLGVMTTWYGSPFALAGKYTFATNNKLLNFSIGGIAGSSGFLMNFKGYGALGFGIGTFGTRKLNASIGLGYSHFSSFGGKELIKSGTYYADFNNPNIYDYKYENVRPGKTGGLAISAGGFAKIGKKTGFVMDFLYLNMTNKTIENNFVYSSTYIYDQFGNAYSESVEVTKNENQSYATHVLIVMPGIRVQGKENSAFQFNLSGVSLRFSNPDAFFNGNLTFPLPSFSWFYKF